MVENLISTVIDLQSANIPEQFKGFLDLIFKFFMLRFIENIGGFANKLQSSLNDIKVFFEQDLSESNNDLIKNYINQIEKTFFNAILSPLELSESVVDTILNSIESRSSLKFLSLLELGFEHYLKSDNIPQTFTQVFNKILVILNFYGFKTTNYIEITVLKLLEFNIPKNLILEKLQGAEFVPDVLDDEISSEELIQTYFDWILRERKEFSPMNYLTSVLENLEIILNETSSICRLLAYHFFLTIEEFNYHHYVNSVVYKFDREIQELSSSRLCDHGLSLQYLTNRELGTSPFYERGFRYSMNPYGFPESTRFCYDRAVLFGKFNGNYLQNDFFLDDSCLPQQFIMICGESGYYICDYSPNGFFGRKIMPDEKSELKLNSVFRLGLELFIYVKSIGQHKEGYSVNLEVMKGCGLRGAITECVFRNNTIKIGSNPENDLIISHCTVSRNHCELILENGSIYLKDVKNSGGTYKNLKSYDEIIKGVPSQFYLIETDQEYMLNDFVCKFVLIK